MSLFKNFKPSCMVSLFFINQDYNSVLPLSIYDFYLRAWTAVLKYRLNEIVTFHKIFLHKTSDLCKATYHLLYINFGAMCSFMEKERNI